MDQQTISEELSSFWQAYSDWKEQLTPKQRREYRDDMVGRAQMFSDFMDRVETKVLVMQLGPEADKVHGWAIEAADIAEHVREIRALGYIADAVYGKERR